MNDQARAAVHGWQRTVDAAWGQQADLLSAVSAEVPAGPIHTDTRELTPAEVAMARSVFGDSLDTIRIKLSEGGVGGLVDLDGRARALPDHVYFPEGTFANPPSNFEHMLIHELTHIWQYQHGHTVIELLPDAIASDYDYEGPEGLVEALRQGKKFDEFNFEEQAQIAADYHVKARDGENTSAYDPYIDEIRRHPPPPPKEEPRGHGNR